MNEKEQRQAMVKPQVQRLKDLGMGLKVSKVLGARVLVKPVKPYTEMDEVEKKGLLYVPESVKETNTPLPTTGVVILVGPEVPEEKFWYNRATGHKMANAGMHSAMNVAGLELVGEPLLKEGDMVMFSKYAGMDIVVDQGEFKLLQFAEIACVLSVEDPEAVVVVNA